MKWKIADLHTWLNLISAIILVVGLGSAILIYQTAQNYLGGVLGYEEGGGSVYPNMPEDSKKYLRDLQLYGGKANMLMDELVNGLFVPDVIHAKKGQPLRLNFYREEESGCINEVVFESLHCPSSITAFWR